MSTTELPVQQEATPAVLLQLAIQQNLDIDKMEKLLGLQERWQATQARKEFLTAISKFQASVPALEKTKQVAFGTTKYKYAPLVEIAASIKTAMSENGLSHRWEIGDETDKITCTCIISHINGHSERTTMSAAKDASGGKNEIQQRGSTITYLQRYTLIASLGISTADEDVDGRKDEPVIKETRPVVVNAGDGKTDSGKIHNQGLKPWLNLGTKEWDNAFVKIHSGSITMDDVMDNYRISKKNHENLLNPKFVYNPAEHVQLS